MNWSGDIMVELCYQEYGSPEQFFNELENEGWKFSVDGEVTYLLNNDDEMYDFIYVNENQWPNIKKELIQHLKEGKGAHISMKFGDERASWLVYIYPNFEKVHFVVEQYKKSIPEMEITDFSWHLSYIIPGFIKTGYSVQNVICCTEHS